MQEPSTYTKYDIDVNNEEFNCQSLFARRPREAAKLYELCLDHYGILKDITKDATILKIAKSACHLSSECDVFKLCKMGDKIYTECKVSGTKVSG